MMRGATRTAARSGRTARTPAGSQWELLAYLALLGSVALLLVRFLLPDAALPAAMAAGFGYALTPWVVLIVVVRVQLPFLSGDDDVVLGMEDDRRRRRVYLVAWPSLGLAIPHVLVLAQIFQLWWSGR